MGAAHGRRPRHAARPQAQLRPFRLDTIPAPRPQRRGGIQHREPPALGSCSDPRTPRGSMHPGAVLSLGLPGLVAAYAEGGMLESDILFFDGAALEPGAGLLALAAIVMVGSVGGWRSRRERPASAAGQKPSAGPAWHHLSAEETLARLGGSQEGLSPDEARQDRKSVV